MQQLPFSPSQFFNSPAVSSSGKQMTSTPAKITGSTPSSTPLKATLTLTPLLKDDAKDHEGDVITPKIKKILTKATPKTPTPLKVALDRVTQELHGGKMVSSVVL